MLRRFRLAYLDAVRGSRETFIWNDHEFLVSYAKYLIEFLETKFGIPPLKE